ncbi:hypothetical protein PZE06_12900 [Robertmurraya sp. DFI.2.37]|uniref:hypothetical protein n=1 Tax=Robertmurraya sp. DFI.2.37 TaxID=3031819 RepID=UPI000BA7300B|nr:hypothetical protein [Robertmurraya sp. DFI.2.37]MDF1509069.1 hypothetical protein [Robertmurraya sp. DFI.2.37]PAE22431.1 hypothetical protein CHH80_00245 [Bacillus sp. 7504-2]
MENKKKLSLPENAKIEEEVNAIVMKGLVVPEPFHKLLLNMSRTIGFRFLFREKKEMTVVTLLMMILFVTAQEQASETTNYYGVIMLLSPILYGLLSIIPLLSSYMNHTTEVEMTCTYNLYQLAAFRMIAFSLFCFLLNTVWVFFMAMKLSSFAFLQGFLIATTSLFLFSLLFLYALSFFKSLLIKVGVMFGWMGLNLLFLIFDSIRYQQLLESIPWYLYGGIIVLTFYLYVKKLNNLMQDHKKRGVIDYVNG